MDTEIEIKFLVSHDISDRLPGLLQSYQILKHDQRRLANTYFDTAELALRRMDAGLRIRSQDGELEQTIKLAGSQVGGLHQRPEYNVALTEHSPDLSRFPAHIWPAGVEPESLQQALQPLFCTDFTRQRWLLGVADGSEIELAFDRGEIRVQGRQEPILELELELVRGDASQLFELADILVKQGGLRLGAVSKAQRGYRLAGLSPAPALRPLEHIPLAGHESCEQAMVRLLHQGLRHWQFHEEAWVTTPGIDWLVQLREGVSLVHQILLMFGGLVSHRVNSAWIDDLLWLQQQLSWLDKAQMLGHLSAEKGHYLRRLDCQKALLAELAEQQAQLPDEPQLRELLHGPRYGRLMLGLTHWLYRQDWRAGLSEEQVAKLAAPVAGLARQLMDDSWQTLRRSALGDERLGRERYIQQKGKLRRNLLVGLCFGELYPAEARMGFRMPWLDILRGIEDLDMLSPLEEARERLAAEDREELDDWLERKRRFLLEALEQSRAQALLLEPYWR
ncbi:inorganic triphosphatase [Zobellella endophytica]|uniref:Inorganic triphosphatase n=1 Tax=Zobellella endophytica TaxID=2116700 RepID=A0A2P7QTX2_9GAMM|nr:CYTH domain-containing protein [Zobellella endophytica]PSJ41417.1 inorganic triphosphatase [Zobellella endophytica]